MVFREAPYGELVSTTMRVMTWNVWGRFGPWQERAPGIVHAIQAAAPDVVFLQECWCDDSGANQAEPLGQQLGMEHHFGAGELLSNSNPWAAPNLLPDQRIDYIFTGWPRAGGVGSVARVSVAGTETPQAPFPPSDHYAVVADIRY